MSLSASDTLTDDAIRVLMIEQVEREIAARKHVRIKRAWNDYDDYTYNAALGAWECDGGGRDSGGGIAAWGTL